MQHRSIHCSPCILLGLLLISTPLLCCCLPVGISTWLNNSRLHTFADNLFRYPLPRETEEVKRHAEVTLLGNGNHCDFIAQRFLVTELSREEIEAYYRGVALPPVSGEDQAQVTDDGLLPVRVDFEDQISADQRLQVEIKLLEIVYPPFWEFDLRCH
jgi:hypothetical protein